MTWNGMTEPLEAGDRVRIVSSNDLRDVGLIGVCVGYTLPGEMLNEYPWDGSNRAPNKVLRYTVHYDADGAVAAYLRESLYKLPPDWDEVLERTKEQQPTEEKA